MDEKVKQNFNQEIITEQKQQVYPNNMVKLPSQGLLYPENNPLSKGYVEMKFMTTKEENILTTESYLRNDVVIDKFLESMIVSPIFDYNSLLVGDKDALVLYSRVYGYGEIYSFEVTSPSGRKQKVEINLEELPYKEFDTTKFTRGDNRFHYKVESKKGNFDLEFKLLTVGDEKDISKKLQKVKSFGGSDRQITTRLEQMILSVNGNDDPNMVKFFVENDFLARDAREFRKYVASLQPGPNLEIEVIDEGTGMPFRTSVAIGPSFFWPDSGL